MIPLQDPRAAWSAAIFCQRQVKGGAAQTAEPVGRRRYGGHLPARRRGAGLRKGPAAEKQSKPAALLRSQRKPARGGQIRFLADFGQFADGCGDTARLEGLLHRPQRIARGGGPHHDQPRRREAEEIAAQTVQRAGLERGEILLYPDNGTFARRCEYRERQSKSDGRAGMEGSRRAQLVQFAQGEAAVKSPIGRNQMGKTSLSAQRVKGIALDHGFAYVLCSFSLIP